MSLGETGSEVILLIPSLASEVILKKITLIMGSFNIFLFGGTAEAELGKAFIDTLSHYTTKI